ncbi:MAG TPA: hypothetical protein VF818_03320 [Ktedonobacterales bacterium]
MAGADKKAAKQPAKASGGFTDEKCAAADASRAARSAVSGGRGGGGVTSRSLDE